MSNHLCIECRRDCDCDGLHMLTDCTQCSACRGREMRRVYNALGTPGAPPKVVFIAKDDKD